MVTADQVNEIFALLDQAQKEHAERHGDAYRRTTHMVSDIADEATKKSAGAFTREQVLETWLCVMVANALEASGAVPLHRQN